MSVPTSQSIPAPYYAPVGREVAIASGAMAGPYDSTEADFIARRVVDAL